MDGTGMVLIAEDNAEDVLLLKKAMQKAGINSPVHFVRDGEEVLLYLQGLGRYSDRDAFPLPAMIILDIKMPKRTGLEVLQWMSEHREFAVVPTVVLSSSNLESDIRKAYHLGANTYFVKPTNYDELVNTVKALQSYWGKAQKVRARNLAAQPSQE